MAEPASGAGAPVIRMRQLRKVYGDFVAVHDLDLEVHRGDVFAFLGPNGAGKTTTIRMLMGMLVPTQGEAEILGLDCRGDSVELKRRIGYLPDNPAFYDFLRGGEIARFVGQMHGIPDAVLEPRLRVLFESLGLTEAEHEFAVNYSTGMKKKLALCCALVHDPPVLILDEPTNGLDPIAARQVQALLRQCADQGRTVFLSTHLLDMAQRLCGRVGIIHQGRLAAVGTLDELRSALAPGGSLEDIFFKVTQATAEGEAAPPTTAPAAAPARVTTTVPTDGTTTA